MSARPSGSDRAPVAEVVFEFSIDGRPSYYRNLAKRYSDLCLTRGGRVVAIRRDSKDSNHLRLQIWCRRGHAFSVSSRHFVVGSWCRECRKVEQREEKAQALQELAKLALRRGGKLLSVEYRNARLPLQWECCDGHTWRASADNVRNKGSWCPECALADLFLARDAAHRRRRRLKGNDVARRVFSKF